MTAFNKAWTVLKDSAGLPYKNRVAGGKWLPGTEDGAVRAPKPHKWLPQTPLKMPISSEYGTENQPQTTAQALQQGIPPIGPPPTQVSTERTEQMGIEDWWKNHPMNPDKTVLNNNPPFGPEGEQQ